jgi:hypothetical protein
MLPTVHRVLDVEKIRDGGSLAAHFTGDSGEYILLIQLRSVVDTAPGSPPRIERLGFDHPILIDCDPKKRPPDTDQVIYSVLSGPSSPVSWSEARKLLRAISNRADELNGIETDWLQEMVDVASYEGRVPPTAA